MGHQGKGLTADEQLAIKKMMEQGVRPIEIAAKIKRSANCVYWFLRSNNITVKRVANRTPERLFPMIPESIELSQLPDTFLFRHINYAIP